MAIHPIEFRYGTPEMKNIWEEEKIGAYKTLINVTTGDAYTFFVNKSTQILNDGTFFFELNDKFYKATLKNPPVISVLTNGKKVYFDQLPVIENGRTLVPIRFISEAFGAKVSWDGATSTATVVADGHTLKFTENQSTYYYDGEARTLDQPATIVNNRMMLPIRVISEDLGKQVFWEESNSGLIVITNNPFNKDLIFGGVDALKTYYTKVK